MKGYLALCFLAVYLVQSSYGQRPNAFCSSRGSGDYADPNRCDGYIACNGPMMYNRDCPKGLHFSEKTDRCDWPYNIKPPCKKGSSKSNKIIICERGKRTLSCGNNEVIQIINANYGRTSRNVCGRTRYGNTNCRAGSSRDLVSMKCNKKQTCELYASNTVFGDPCRNMKKYLEVEYKCVKGKKDSDVKDIAICENKRNIIACGANKVINIITANYGRTDRSTCRTGSTRNTNCRSRNSVDKVARMCNKKPMCNLFASNSVFGDPCRYTSKYLNVKYTCEGQNNPKKTCKEAQAYMKNLRPGMFIPKCKADGSYEEKQCHSSLGQCWCVNTITGIEITGTRKSPGSLVDCGQQNCPTTAANIKRRLPGSFVPKCNADGSFQEKQCHGSTGNCWCVDTNSGIEIRGTRRGPRQGKVTCDAKSCQKARSNAIATRKPGVFVPKCKRDGSFEEKQCHKSTGHCWCVNPNTGKEIRGTRKRNNQGPVTCDAKSCQKARSNAIATRKPGVFVPKCKRDGSFEEKQCHKSTGHCWCVNPNTGKEIRGTRKRNNQGPVTCGKSSCNKARANTRGKPGEFVPQCKSDGSFVEIQCHASTGHCWCVDADTGVEIRGTRRARGQGRPKCVIRPCDKARANTVRNLGSFVPTCRADGSFAPKQCHASTGHCWCVEIDTGVEIHGTRKAANQGLVICGAAFAAECPVEQGYCVKSGGSAQKSGVVRFNTLNGNTKQRRKACLAMCLTYPGATACEVVWDRANRGCYVHTKEVVNGNGDDRQQCWVFSKCKSRKGPQCAKERGYCLKSNGRDQNSGVVKFTNLDTSSFKRQQACLEMCHAYPGAQGCEAIWNRRNRGCYVHTRQVSKGNNHARHACWIFAKCKDSTYTAPHTAQCPMEKGYCVSSNGRDQNSGVIRLNKLDGNRADRQRACLDMCLTYPGATGCEVIWNRSNRGCYVHTKDVVKGNNNGDHGCWVFSKCPHISPGRKCIQEKGYCVKRNGWDQNRGVLKINTLDTNTPLRQEACLAMCQEYPDATGCEAIWNRFNRGCYVHTQEVAKGNNRSKHACWVFSKCTNPVVNPCKANNGGCSDYCSYRNSRVTCSCKVGYILSANKKTCVSVLPMNKRPSSG